MRREAARASTYYVKGKGVVFRDSRRECLRASLCEGIRLLLDKETAIQIWNAMVEEDQARRQKGEETRAIRNLRDLQKWVKANLGRIYLRHVNDGLGVTDLLALDHSGVYLVTVMAVSGMKHCVCVDTNAKIIYDCMETVGMSLSKDALALCVGDDQEFSTIGEVRQVQYSSSNASGHRNSKKKARDRARREAYEKKKKLKGLD